MKNFFNPHSVAIFASMKEGKTGYEIVKNYGKIEKFRIY